MRSMNGKITNLYLSNYKVFRYLELNLNSYNVFVGPNSSGKTSIADVLIFIRETLRMFSQDQYKSTTNFNRVLRQAFRMGTYEPFIVYITLEIDKLTYAYKVTFELIDDKRVTIVANEEFTIRSPVTGDYELDASFELLKIIGTRKIRALRQIKGPGFGKYRSEFEGPYSYFDASILKEIYTKAKKNDLYFEPIDNFFKFWDRIRFYNFNIYNKNRITGTREISNENIISEDFQNILEVLLNINFQQPEIFDEIKGWLASLVPNIKDIIINTSKKRGSAFLSFTEEGWNKQYVPLSQASDGIIRLLCILVILFNKEKPSIIIFDEPENGIHPAIRSYIADFSIAASEDSQVLFLTHDSESLRKFELNKIYYFKREKSEVIVKKLSDVHSLTETIKALKDVEKKTLISMHSTDSL